MSILSTSGWDEYELLDSGRGQRLERFGPYTLARPDPGALWQPGLSREVWEKADALFEEVEKKGKWRLKRPMLEKWDMQWQHIRFYTKLSPFKHTGIFPEQSINWEWLKSMIKNHESRSKHKRLQILNLFGYTGIASLVCAAAGAEVTHIDGSYPTIGWARENQALSGLSDAPIRWILDDCLKFVHREIRRGSRYDGIIMDPPVFGHGPHGERWEFGENFPELLAACSRILSDHPHFILINAYAVSSSSLMLHNMLMDMTQQLGGMVESGELALEEKNRKRLLSTGIFARWSRE